MIVLIMLCGLKVVFALELDNYILTLYIYHPPT